MMARRRRYFRFVFVAVLIVAAVFVSAAGSVAAIAPVPSPNANILANGDLATGSETQPDDWRTEAWLNDPAAFAYTWSHPADGGPGELKVAALKANDARWMQSLSLKPGWYHVSAEIRTENVGAHATGATVSIMEDGIMSADIRGTSGWQRVDFYLKVGRRGADVNVALRLGGYGSLNTGTAYFRLPRVQRVSAPPPGATHVFDLAAIRAASEPKPVGSPITLVATFMLLIAISAYGWWMFGSEEPSGVAQRPSRAVRRAEARRAR